MSSKCEETKSMSIYSVKDVKTGQFMSLELYLNDLECERAMKNVLRLHPDNLLNQFPEDFVLYRLGTFKPEKCIETVYDEPIKVCDLKDIVQKKENK